ncbi:LacI family DNA-binding transcriptional regulator [Halomonas sp. BM-2019]|uniref:LacI family DNA-binding transcriptional regulator n=1 Tax=Halomonas sp. BM-2019 TaxID=2811227 RepID=UPI001B3C3134|nr:MAG: LacI family DNA-binding transcriptional regulator [Halomonas sp. BM-2019]
MVSIKDVARLAGTSFKTVSRVINDDPAVREETRARVRQAIEELGYRPNSAARTMRSQRSGVIGFISDRVTTQPHSGDILRGAQQVGDAHDKVLMVVNIDRDAGFRHRQRALDMLLERRVEGLLYACDYHREVELPKEMGMVPSVLANGFASGIEVPTFLPDEQRAAREITRLLLAQGHRCIAYLGLNPRLAAASLRQAGYRQALEEAGIAVDEALMQPAEVGVLDGDERSTVEATIDRLLTSSPRPTAILCGQDSTAMQLYLALASRGQCVGRDMAVASFDDQRPISIFLTPGLTTMRLPHLEMGQQAMRCLLSQEREGGTTLVPFARVERQSHLGPGSPRRSALSESAVGDGP